MLLYPNIPAICIQQAAQAYHVPRALIMAIVKVEGGKKGMISHNANGTCDYGVMQINSVWLQQLKAYGITPEKLQHDACTNIWVGSWILHQKMKQAKDMWQGIGNYHSYSMTYNRAYQWKVWQAYTINLRARYN